MNTKQKLHQAKLSDLSEIFKAQASSGLTAKERWCHNSVTIHGYNYWKHQLKENVVDALISDIVPVNAALLDPYPVCSESRDSTIRAISLLFWRYLIMTSISESALPYLMNRYSGWYRWCIMLRDADPSCFNGIYIVCGYTDLRHGIDSLSAIIKQRYKMSLFVQNTLFIFCGHSSSKINGLLWEGDGFLLLYKRVEEGRFTCSISSKELRHMSPDQFRYLLKGSSIDPLIRDITPKYSA